MQEAKLARGIAAEEARVRPDADAAEVQAIGVPAGLEGEVTRREPIGVEPAGLLEQRETPVVGMDQGAAEAPGQLAAPEPVPRIAILVHPARIVEQGKERDDLGIGAESFGQEAAVLVHAAPMQDTVHPAVGEAVALEDLGDHHRGAGSCHGAGPRGRVTWSTLGYVSGIGTMRRQGSWLAWRSCVPDVDGTRLLPPGRGRHLSLIRARRRARLVRGLCAAANRRVPSR